jgi:peptide/nickel transport system permease protein
MQDYMLRRTGTMLFVLLGVSMITFSLIFFTPGDPARTILRQQTGGRIPSDEAIQEFREDHGLNKPIPVQYINWIWDVLHGDLRKSYYTNTPVTTMIMNRLPQTLKLAIAGMFVALLIALPTGVISAVHQGEVPDYASQTAALLGVSMPGFWLGYLLIIVFSLQLDMFPVAGVGSLEHLILPAITLGAGLAAIVTRLIRSSLLEVLDEDYIQTARSKGLRERIVVYKHALRNALIPVITIVGLQFGYLLNGAVIVEIVFQRPGLGNLLIDAIFARDYPVVQGIVLLVAVIFVLTNFLVDMTYRVIDPRISFDAGEQ